MAINFSKYLVLTCIPFCMSCSMQTSKHEAETEKNTDTVTLLNKPGTVQNTLKYYDFNTLKKTLPIKIDNYTPVDTAGGETLSKETSGGPQSYARQEYLDAEKSIVVSVVDYSQAKQTRGDLLGMYIRNASTKVADVEFKEEKTSDSSKIFTRFTKDDQYKSVIAFYKDNFIVTVDGNDKTSMTYLKKIASDIFSKLPQ